MYCMWAVYQCTCILKMGLHNYCYRNIITPWNVAIICGNYTGCMSLTSMSSGGDDSFRSPWSLARPFTPCYINSTSLAFVGRTPSLTVSANYHGIRLYFTLFVLGGLANKPRWIAIVRQLFLIFGWLYIPSVLRMCLIKFFGEGSQITFKPINWIVICNQTVV